MKLNGSNYNNGAKLVKIMKMKKKKETKKFTITTI